MDQIVGLQINEEFLSFLFPWPIFQVIHHCFGAA